MKYSLDVVDIDTSLDESDEIYHQNFIHCEQQVSHVFFLQVIANDEGL